MRKHPNNRKVYAERNSSRTAHDGYTPVGRDLFQWGDSRRGNGFYSEARFNRLMTSRGAMPRSEDQKGLVSEVELFSVSYFCRRVASLRNVTETLILGVRSNQR